MLRAILFPLANKFIRRQLDSAVNTRFSQEFTRLILLLAHIVRIIAEEEPIESYYQVKEELNNNNNNNNNTLSGTAGADLSDDNAKVDIKRAVIDINMSKYIKDVNIFRNVCSIGFGGDVQ